MNIPYRLSIQTAPATEPVTTAEAKTHMRVDSSSEDTYIANLITSVRESVELYISQALITQEWNMFLDRFPCQESDAWWDGVREMRIGDLASSMPIVIPLYPLQSVTHIKTYSNADVATTFSSSNYQVSAYSGLRARSGRITLRQGSSWPTFEREADGVEIRFIAGYGDANAVPKAIKQAILEEIAARFQSRGECTMGVISDQMSKSLLAQFKKVSI